MSLQVSHNHAEKQVGVRMQQCWCHCTPVWGPRRSKEIHCKTTQASISPKGGQTDVTQLLFSPVDTKCNTTPNAKSSLTAPVPLKWKKSCHARTERTVGPQLSSSNCKSEWRGKQSRVKCSPRRWNHLERQVSTGAGWAEPTAFAHAENVRLDSSTDISTGNCCWNMSSDAANKQKKLLMSIVPGWLFYTAWCEKWLREATA